MPSLRCECNQLLNFRAEQAGQRVRCPACKKEFHLPAQTATEAADDVLPLENIEIPPPAEKPKYALRESNVSATPEPEAPPSTGQNKFELQPEGEYEVRPPDEPLPPRPSRDRLSDRRAAKRRVADLMPKVDASTRFEDALKGAFRYPFHPDALASLIAAVIALAVVSVLCFFLLLIPYVGGLISGVGSVFVTGYVLCFLLLVVEYGAGGRADVPDWPDLSDFRETVLKPLLMIAVVGVIGFAPALLYEGWVAQPHRLVAWALQAAGLFYFLMGVLCMAVSGAPEGFDPRFVVQSIRRVPKPYIMVWGIAVGGTLVAMGAESLLRAVPIAGSLFNLALGFYLGMVVARALGLLHYLHRKELGLDDEADGEVRGEGGQNRS